MKATIKCYCKSEFLQVFNFEILCYSRKLDACKKLHSPIHWAWSTAVDTSKSGACNCDCKNRDLLVCL